MVGCHNVFEKNSGIQFYRFPTNPEKRSKWIAAVKRDCWVPNDNTWICSTHFVTGKRSDNPLAPNYVPALFPQLNSPVKRKLEKEGSSFKRRQETKRKRLSVQSSAVRNKRTTDKDGSTQDSNKDKEGFDCEAEISGTEARVDIADNSVVEACEQVSQELDNDDYDDCVDYEGDNVTLEPICFEDISWAPPVLNCDFCDKMEEELFKARRVNKQLASANKMLSAKVFGRESLRGSDAKVHYFTGLQSYEILEIVFEFVTSRLPDSFASSSCNIFDQFLLVMMRLRLNVGVQDLGYRFDIHPSTVCRYFSKWLDVLYTKLHCFINWPERDTLLKTMPMVFRRAFKTCAIIIDCFEIFIERPTSLVARAQTWSNYKKHNTVKYLIGITPQGSVSFISKGWGGRVSDVHLTENSGLLQHLLPGDVVLADRGFTIQDSVGLLCAEVKHPPFTRGKPQLSKLEVDSARQLSQVRIHVERVIGAVRQKYMILQSTLPISMVACYGEDKLSPIDKIVTISCALYNHCNSVVPFD